MQVLLTFDVEIWCGGWERLDERFPAAFRRYVYGSSSKGDFALPHILETMTRHGLKGVFFVEPMFAARFGVEHLAVIVDMLNDAGQEVQLHLHPEWTDEIRPCPLPGKHGKRQHLHYYSLEEQTRLIQYALEVLRSVHTGEVTAFRAGSFAANGDTFTALRANGLRQDSSVNATQDISVADLRPSIDLYCPSTVGGVAEYPLTVFVDGLGRQRHAQLGACSSGEMVSAIECAERAGWEHFVILAHNFELLKVGSAEPDLVVVARFDRLCRYLGRRVQDLPTTGFRHLEGKSSPVDVPLPRVPLRSTLQRYSEQLVRRLY